MVGWSWLFPPYRWHFDARALSHVRATAFDGACLRGKCEDDPALGYDLMKRFAQVLIERLQWTRLRLLDVYGERRRLSAPAPGPMVPLPFVVRERARETADTWTLTLEPLEGRGAGDRPGPVRDGVRLRGRRGADLGQRRHRIVPGRSC